MSEPLRIAEARILQRGAPILSVKDDAGHTSFTALDPPASEVPFWLHRHDVHAYEAARLKLKDQPRLASAVELVMIDLAAQHAKTPAWQYLGGPVRYKIRILTPLKGKTEEDLRTEVKKAWARGARAFKVPLIAPGPVARIESLIGNLRNDTSEAADFVLDSAQQLPLRQAQDLAMALEPMHLLWFEDPCAFASSVALERFTQATVTPVGVRRSLKTAKACLDALAAGAGIIRPDICQFGLTGVRRIAALAESYYVAVAPFVSRSYPETVAALHLAMAMPNFYIQEAEELTLEDGYTRLRVAPGMGTEMDV